MEAILSFFRELKTSNNDYFVKLLQMKSQIVKNSEYT